MTVTVDGRELANVHGSSVEVEATLSNVGLHTVFVECRFENESDTFETSVDIVEPAQVTVHLRNFTQPGEPFVYNEGPITFTVGDMEITSSDSVVVPVLPDAEYEIFADHADFVPLWALITDHDTGELIEFYHVRDQSSPVHVATSASIDVFKIRESDITSIQNTYHEWQDDTSPYYTVDDLRQALYQRYRPYTGTLNRITSEKVTVWLPGIDLQRTSGIRQAVEKLFVNDGDDHVPNLTGGVIQSTELVFDEAAPARPIIYVRIGDFAHQNESLTDDGGIYESTVVLPASSDLPTSMATFLQGIGLHGSVGNDPLDDYVDGRGSPSPFARLALKILYATPTNARF